MFESLDALLAKDSSYHVAGPCAESLIAAAEQELNLSLPSDVRSFALRYGTIFGPRGSISILNPRSDLHSGQGATALFWTLDRRERGPFPTTLLVLDDTDYPAICVDTSRGSRVVLLHDNQVPPKTETAARSFEVWVDEWARVRLDDD